MHASISMYVPKRYYNVVSWAQEHYKHNFTKIVWSLLEEYVKDEMQTEEIQKEVEKHEQTRS